MGVAEKKMLSSCIKMGSGALIEESSIPTISRARSPLSAQ